MPHHWATPLAYRDTLLHGDSKVLAKAIPPSSVDLCFTDPVYWNLNDYLWLGRVLNRVLAPKGVALIWVSVDKLPRCRAVLEDMGLDFVYQFTYTVTAKTSRMRWYNIFCWSTVCLWYQRPGMATKPHRWIPDTYNQTLVDADDVLTSITGCRIYADTFVSTGGPQTRYVWNKNSGVVSHLIDAFTRPGDVVYDPFAGYGVVPRVCLESGRHFIASEIERDVYDKGVEILKNQPIRLEESLL